MPERFELVKWYLDAVEPDGAASIAYWASLTWLGVSVAWHNATRYAPGQPPAERSSLRAVPPPVFEERRVAWHSERVGLETTHDAVTPGVSVTLLDDARGRIVWECLAPSARTRFTRDGAATDATGYAERMTMTVVPWELPIDELRWGRWMSDDASQSLVWIDWRGPLPSRWVVHQGALCADAEVRDDRLAMGAGQLSLGEPRVLHDRSVGKLLRSLAGMARIAARIPMAWHETKWCCRATWSDRSHTNTTGWAIHEIVRFS